MRESYMYYMDKLEGEYKKVFEQINMYVSTQFVDYTIQEERMSELLDMFLNAQASGKPVKKIVGNNVEEFCKVFCSDFGTENKIRHILDSVKSIAIFTFIMSLLDILILFIDFTSGEVVDFWGAFTDLNISGYLLGFAIAGVLSFIINLFIRKIMFKFKKISMNMLNGLTIVAMIVMFIIMMILMESSSTNFIKCPVWLLEGVSLAYLIFYYILNFKRVREEKKHKIYFGDMVKDEIKKDFPDTMQKIYDKKNKRNIKRGKGELTIEEFIEKQEKQCRLSDKMRFFYYLFPIAAVIVVLVIEILNGGFETVFDAILMIAILLAVEYPIMMFFRKIDKSNTTMTRQWIKNLKAGNVTLHQDQTDREI